MVWQQKLNLPIYIPLHFIAVWQMAAEGQSDKLASDMEVYINEGCLIESLHTGKMAPIVIHQRLLNISGDQTVDVSPVRFRPWWQWQWVTSTDADFLWGQHSGSCSSLIKMHSLWWWLCWKSVLRSWEFALSNTVIMFFVSVLVSMEINRRYYFEVTCMFWFS